MTESFTRAELCDWLIWGTLIVEYFWGRSDMDLKNEAKKKAKIRKEKHAFDDLTIGEMR